MVIKRYFAKHILSGLIHDNRNFGGQKIWRDRVKTVTFQNLYNCLVRCMAQLSYYDVSGKMKILLMNKEVLFKFSIAS